MVEKIGQIVRPIRRIRDAGTNGGDAGSDAGSAGSDAGSAGSDAGSDAGSAGSGAGSDAESDAGSGSIPNHLIYTHVEIARWQNGDGVLTAINDVRAFGRIDTPQILKATSSEETRHCRRRHHSRQMRHCRRRHHLRKMWHSRKGRHCRNGRGKCIWEVGGRKWEVGGGKWKVAFYASVIDGIVSCVAGGVVIDGVIRGGGGGGSGRGGGVAVDVGVSVIGQLRRSVIGQLRRRRRLRRR